MLRKGRACVGGGTRGEDLDRPLGYEYQQKQAWTTVEYHRRLPVQNRSRGAVSPGTKTFSN